MIHYYVMQGLGVLFFAGAIAFVMWVIMKSLDALRNDSGEIEYFDEELSDEKV